MSRLVAVLILGCACASAPSPSPVQGELRVAVTVDDLPRHGPEAPGQDRLALHRALLAVLGRHQVPRVYGFVNSGRAQPGDRAALEAWVAAGYPLGNHTAHHPTIDKVGLQAYLADVDAGEPLLAELLGPGQEQVWKVSAGSLTWGASRAQRSASRSSISSASEGWFCPSAVARAPSSTWRASSLRPPPISASPRATSAAA